jgi:hypothetical protein
VAVPMPTATTRWRCAHCGNLTRFDVVRSSRVRQYLHFTLAGDAEVEESEVLAETVEEVRCRWCGGNDTIEVVPKVGAEDAEQA